MNDLAEKILAAFEDDEICCYYKYFTHRLPGIPLKEIKKTMQELKKLGLVELVRGLLSEDGPGYFGSGFQITRKGWAMRREIIDKMQIIEV